MAGGPSVPAVVTRRCRSGASARTPRRSIRSMSLRVDDLCGLGLIHIKHGADEPPRADLAQAAAGRPSRPASTRCGRGEHLILLRPPRCRRRRVGARRTRVLDSLAGADLGRRAQRPTIRLRHRDRHPAAAQSRAAGQGRVATLDVLSGAPGHARLGRAGYLETRVSARSVGANFRRAGRGLPTSTLDAIPGACGTTQHPEFPAAGFAGFAAGRRRSRPPPAGAAADPAGRRQGTSAPAYRAGRGPRPRLVRLLAERPAQAAESLAGLGRGCRPGVTPAGTRARSSSRSA